MLAAMRSWFAGHGYLEVPTPAIVASGALEPQLFTLEAGGGVLRTSPEFALKRAFASGLPRIYEIGPCFRGREHGTWHRQEFLMCEWYRAGAGLFDLMTDVESLIEHCRRALGESSPLAWTRTTVRQAFLSATGIDIATATASDLADTGEDWDTAFFRRWVEDVEPTFVAPTFLYDWPASQAALATVRTDGPMPIAERFEVFLNGYELANAFHEEGNTATIRSRWEDYNSQRAASGEPPHPIDETFLSAIGKMPRGSGIALGVDRLVAALCGWESIHRGWVGTPSV